jgi:hypothetical protein
MWLIAAALVLLAIVVIVLWFHGADTRWRR